MKIYHFGILYLLLCSVFSYAADSDLSVAPLWLYNGTWELTDSNSNPGATSDTIVNVCKLIGRYFACEQTINGKLSSLIIFIPSDKPGHYYTQGVLPEGWATGRGQLDIAGKLWTYRSQATDNGKSTYFRTTNVFTGKDKIHFEVSQSSDGEHWSVTKSGDERRKAD